MLTAKLSTYSPEEVDLLLEVLEPSIVAISDYSHTDCSRTDNCNSCKVKHVCYDLMKFCDYLSLEQKFGYPHCKK